jgi:hypothetical protein
VSEEEVRDDARRVGVESSLERLCEPLRHRLELGRLLRARHRLLTRQPVAQDVDADVEELTLRPVPVLTETDTERPIGQRIRDGDDLAAHRTMSAFLTMECADP